MTFASIFLLKPLGSVERNGIFVPWLTVVLNTYWTRLAYFTDLEGIDEKLEMATKEVADHLAVIADKQAPALAAEREGITPSVGREADPKAAGDRSGEAATGDKAGISQRNTRASPSGTGHVKGGRQ